MEIHHGATRTGRPHLQTESATTQPVPREIHLSGSTRGIMSVMMSAWTMQSEEATPKAAA